MARLMPNIGGPRESNRGLVATVVHLKLLHAAPVLANALQNHAIQRRLFSAQRGIRLRIVLAYRTVSTSAVFTTTYLLYIFIVRRKGSKDRREGIVSRQGDGPTT